MKQKRTSKLLPILAILGFFVFPSHLDDSFAARKPSIREKALVANSIVKVIELRKLDQLKKRFHHDTGKVRLLTILSPT